MELLNTLGVTQSELDDAINSVKPMPTLLLNDPMWAVKNLRATSVIVEFSEKSFGLIPHTQRTDPPNIKTWDKKSVIRTFHTLHFNLETRISAVDIQNVRQFGTANQALSNTEVLADVIKEHRMQHDLTHEWFYLGAIKGKLVDKDGNEVIDLFNTFGMTEQKTDFKFNTPTTDIGALIEPMIRKMRAGLQGDTSNGVTVLCSPEFFDALVNHKSTKAAWERYQDNVLARENTNGKFAYKGAEFIIYDYTIGSKPMIEAGHAHAYLRGMTKGFVRYNSPANQLNAANTVARPFYISLAPEGHDRGVSVYTESNMLPICLRPQTLMHLTSS